jgi:hypothetical protein
VVDFAFAPPLPLVPAAPPRFAEIRLPPTAPLPLGTDFLQGAAVNKEADSQAPIANRLLHLRGEKEGGQVNDYLDSRSG